MATTDHKVKIWSEQFSTCRRWYVSCLNEDCLDEWVPKGPDGYYGRKLWDSALALGIAHQRNAEARDWHSFIRNRAFRHGRRR